MWALFSLGILSFLPVWAFAGFRRYNKIDMTSFRSDLFKSSFVSCPGTTDSLFHQYMQDLGGLLDKHAPQITRNFHKQKAKWLSQSFQEAKSVKPQLERIWRKKKTAHKRSRLRQQIAQCNALVNSDKASYYKNLVLDNSHDPKKLWKTLTSALHSTVQYSVLPAHCSKKSC